MMFRYLATLFLLIILSKVVFSQKIPNGIYRSVIVDSSADLIELKLVFKGVDSFAMQLFVYDDKYLLSGVYKINKGYLELTYDKFQSDLAGNAYNHTKIINNDSVLNFKIKLENNTKGDSASIKDIVMYCAKSGMELFSKKIPKYYNEEIKMDIPVDLIPFDIHILSKGNRESIVNVTKNYDWTYIVYMAHNIKIFSDARSNFKTKIKNIMKDSFEVIINKELVLMRLSEE